MRKITTTVLSAALATVGTLATAAPTEAATDGTYRTTYTVSRTCAYEDGSESALCLWDASRNGNRIGRSVLNVDYGDGYATIGTPTRKVTRANPLKVTIYGRNGEPYSVKVTHGGQVLARNALIRWVG